MDERAFTPAITVILALAVVVSLIVGIGYIWGLNQVDEGHVGIHTHQGAATGTVHDPGWHWHNPITNDVKDLSTRPNTVNMIGDNEVTVVTKDGQDVFVDVTVRYSINESEAAEFYNQYPNQKRAQKRLIEPTVRSDLRDEASSISVREVITKDGRQSLEQTVTDALRENLDGSGLELEAVQVRDVQPNKEYSNQLEQVQIEETERERKLIEAEADADAQIERADGAAQAEVKKAEGDAEAAKIRDAEITDDVLKDKWLDSIDKSDKVIVTDGSGEDVIIDAESDNNNSGGNGS